MFYEGRRIPVGPAGVAVGRRSENDLVLKGDLVSREHARVASSEGRYFVADLGSMNGTYVNGERLSGESRWLKTGDTIVVGGHELRFVAGEGTRIGQTIDPAMLRIERVELRGDRLSIGRDPSNDLALQDPNVSRVHAEVVKTPGGIEVRDLGSSNGTRVNGQLVKRAVLPPGAEVGIGAYRLVFDGTGFVARDDRGALRLDAHRVGFAVDGKRILAPTNLSVAPGELVAIIGESGAGKSTLIKALAGVALPSEGRVTVNGEEVTARLTDIGYVPQDEIVHRLLTVREALAYSARLRLPEDASDADVQTEVHRVLGEVALEEHAAKRIGSLSGGQRKRAGVAVELLGQPSLLFLDEPTTGLDPGLETLLMEQLRELANNDRAVTVVTHATKNLGMCDRIAVMGRGGELSYFGPPQDALRFFGVDEYDGIYTALVRRPATEWRQKFEAEHSPPPPPPPAPPGTGDEGPSRSLFGQIGVLSSRYTRLLARDRRNLAILLGQVPVLGLLMGGIFERAVFEHGPGRGSNSAQLLFLLVTTAIWLGSIAAAREVVKEKHVLDREQAAGVHLRAYITSKLIVLFGLVAVQALVLCAVVFLLRPLHQESSAYGQIVAIIVATSCTAVTMGLLISAIARSEDQATSYIPLALIPQLFFGGALVGIDKMGEPLATLSAIIFSRWSFAGSGHAADMEGRIAADPPFSQTHEFGDTFFDLALAPTLLILLLFAAVFVGITLALLHQRAVRNRRA